jgi:hypothetical protein
VSRAVCTGPSGFVAVGAGQGGGRICQSPTGEVWTEVSGDSAAKGNVYDVAAAAGPGPLRDH